MKTNWKFYHSLGLLLILVAMVCCGLFIPAAQLLCLWLAYLCGLALFVMIVGSGLTGRFLFGWAINDQNRMSLSRVQMFLWTVVVLSAWLSAVVFNLRTGNIDQAVNVGIRSELWLAMGISTTALIGSPLILASKKKTVDGKIVMASISASTVLSVNSGVSEARVSDLFTGEEATNEDTLDLSRLQNIIFTLILVIAYAISTGNMMVAASASLTKVIDGLPQLSVGAATLLGITNAGYLIGKGTDKPSTQG